MEWPIRARTNTGSSVLSVLMKKRPVLSSCVRPICQTRRRQRLNFEPMPSWLEWKTMFCVASDEFRDCCNTIFNIGWDYHVFISKIGVEL